MHAVSFWFDMNPFSSSHIHLNIPIMFLHTPLVHIPVDLHSLMSMEKYLAVHLANFYILKSTFLQ